MSGRELLSGQLQALSELAKKEPSVEVLWLYGSQAKGCAEENSDYDLAIAFGPQARSEEYVCDELAYQWSMATNENISVIDINKVPVPLSYAVISEGQVVISQNDLRLRTEEQRIWSLWEEFKYEHEKNRQLI